MRIFGGIVEMQNGKGFKPFHLPEQVKIVRFGCIVEILFHPIPESRKSPQAPFFVEVIACDRVGRILIGIEELKGSRNHIHLIGFKNLRIAFIHLNDDMVLVFNQHIRKLGADTFKWRQVL